GPARPLDRVHPRPGGRRGPDHRYRHDRRLVRGVLRTYQGRDARGPHLPLGGAARLAARPPHHPVRQRGQLHRRRGAVRARGRPGQGLRLHPRPDHHPRRGGGVHGDRPVGAARLALGVLGETFGERFGGDPAGRQGTQGRRGRSRGRCEDAMTTPDSPSPRERDEDRAQSAVDDFAYGAGAPRHGFFNRLYTGTGAIDVVGRRRLWYIISAVIVLLSLASILIRGFNFGIDFEGGTRIQFPAGDASTSQVEAVYADTLGSEPETVQTVGSGSTA